MSKQTKQRPNWAYLPTKPDGFFNVVSVNDGKSEGIAVVATEADAQAIVEARDASLILDAIQELIEVQRATRPRVK